MNKRYLIIILATFMVWGCSHRAIYRESTNETMGLATIEGSSKFYGTIFKTTPVAIDNELIINTFMKHKITPGPHNILISYTMSGAPFPIQMDRYSVEIFAEPNHRYITLGNYWETQRAWVEDMDNPMIHWEGNKR